MADITANRADAAPRPDATKRVAGAVGDGALAVRLAHEVLVG